ncbi:MAG: trigger factor [Actinomycetota bacterium]|nr:trigger factor [Actinomycetota bacterium]
MKSTVEALEGNKVKLSVEVDEQEFEKALDAAFRKIAREVRIPGFRPGKAPRRIIEARIGAEAARQEALRDALPDYYAKALQESDIDPIAPPEIDITSGEESGPVAFDAVVEVMPQVNVAGYQNLQVTVPGLEPPDEEVDAQVDRLRRNDAQLNPVSRPARDEDHVTIDRKIYRHDETLQQADDELYEVGSGAMVPELDEQLRGAKVGDILKFNAKVGVPGGAGEEESEADEVTFQILVKDVKEMILPDVTDTWASEASEFETVDELKADIRNRLSMVRKVQAQLALRDEVVHELVKLVDDDAPEPLVGAEMERRLHDLSHRLESQGMELGQWLQATGQSQEQLIEDLRAGSTEAVKADLALRAVVEAEGIEATDADVDTEIERLAERFEQKAAQLRRQLERADQMQAVRSDIRKGKALAWLLEHVEIVDDEGRTIDRADLQLPGTDIGEDVAEEVGEEVGEETEEAPAQEETQHEQAEEEQLQS